MKLRDLINSVEVLKTLSLKELSGVLSYKIFRACQMVDEYLKTYEEVRLKLLSQYGKLNEEGTSYVFEDDKKADAFSKEFNILLDTELEMNVPLLTVQEIESIPSITANNIQTLQWMIK